MFVPCVPKLLLVGQGEEFRPGKGVGDFHEPRLVCPAVLGRQLSKLLRSTRGVMTVGCMVLVVGLFGVLGALLGALRVVAMNMPGMMDGLKDLAATERLRKHLDGGIGKINEGDSVSDK